MSTQGERQPLSGWGAVNPSVATVIDLGPNEVAGQLSRVGERGLIARGLGRSYGDAAQNGGGVVIRLRPPGGDALLDPTTGSVTAAAGVSLDDLLHQLIPHGWFVPVTPGTRFVTVGGAVASDVHGKNHHRDGSFGNHVERLTMMLPDSEVVEIGPDRRPDLFWATIGGMGLTGVMLDVTFRLIPIETSRMLVDTWRVHDLDEAMALMSESDAAARYSVAWIDLLATGAHLGRGMLTNADHAPFESLPGDAGDPLAYRAKQLLTVPPLIPPQGVINKLTVKAFNEVWFRKAPKRRVDEIQTIPSYFHPLDLANSWNRVYGRGGFVQYQIVVPFEAESTMRWVIESMSGAGVPSFLTVLKRFGPGNPAPLGFPTSGWTLAVDVPTGFHDLAPLLRRLDERVLASGGRHYLAKDFHISPEAVRRGYPRFDEWAAVRHSVDPTCRMQSDLSRRLNLANSARKAAS